MRYFVIRTENLTKSYGHRRGIEDLTLEVEPGEVYGVLGPEHSGKSTLFHLLLDFIRPSSGRAFVMGMDSHDQANTIRNKVGFIPNNINLNSRRSGLEILRQMGVSSNGMEWQTVRDLSDELALDLERPVAALSDNEQWKLCMVQAFMNKPDLLLLDEPTPELDVDAQDVLYRLIGEARSEGQTVFFSSSSLCEMERICDRVAVLHQGRLVAVERGMQLRSRALRKIEMRFAEPIKRDAFTKIPNVKNVHVDNNKLRCTLQGDLDGLIKAASEFHVTDIISQQPSLKEAYKLYYKIDD